MATINSETKLLGLIGNPTRHSLSPLIYNTAFRVLGLNMAYMAFTVERDCLEEALTGMTALGFKGFNVTIPHKEAVIPYLDSIHSEAKMIGAVNTVVINQGRLYGYNTDGVGFLRSLEENNITPVDKEIVLLGAGGAAKAVATVLALKGAKGIIIANRSLSRGQELAARINSMGVSSQAFSLGDLSKKVDLDQIDIVINATPVGMYQNKNSDLIAVNSLSRHCIVCDLVYGSKKSSLLQQAQKLGLAAIDGSGMLLYQAAEAFSLFTGLVPPVAEMRKELDVALCQIM